MRAGVLSNSRVVAAVNARFIPFEFDNSKGFPAAFMPGMRLWRQISSIPLYQGQMATAVVLPPSVAFPLDTSGCGHEWERYTAISYHPIPFLKMLATAETRLAKLRRIEKNPTLSAAQKSALEKEMSTWIWRDILSHRTCAMLRR